MGSAIDAAAAALGAAGVLDARNEALTLWGAISGESPGAVWLGRDRPVAAGVAERYRTAVSARSSGVPAAYATGKATFRMLELEVTRNVLIPRPETEGLVQLVLDHFRHDATPLDGYLSRSTVIDPDRPRSTPIDPDRPRSTPIDPDQPRSTGGPDSWGHAADIGTGSGCIATSLAVEGRFERVVATDVSPAALEVARRNGREAARQFPAVRGRLEFRLGDLLAPLGGEKYRVIVSNPPYVSEGEWSALDPAVRDHEPREALVSDAEGMAHTRRVLDGAYAALRPGGLLAIEVDSIRSERALALARERAWTNARLAVDLFDRPRYLLATKESW